MEGRKARADFGVHRVDSRSPAKLALFALIERWWQWFVREGLDTRPSSAEAHSSVTCHSVSGWWGF